MNVLLRGSGTAAAACARLLDRSGISCAIEAGDRRPVPVLMLSHTALCLLQDIFDLPRLLADRPRITRRVVQWGSSEPVAMPHDAIAVSETELLAALGAFDIINAAPSNFTIHAAPPFPDAQITRFGSRLSSAAPVKLAAAAEAATCWVEATEAGWLFLIPGGNDGAWLLAIGGEPEMLAAQSQLIARQITHIGAPSGKFDTSPRMLTALSGSNWLACGTAALAFDPICGDGTAQAVREAILGCAVISAVTRGKAPQPLLSHYHSMLLASMRRHLQLCLPYYAQGGISPWWQEQFAATRTGFDWCTAMLGSYPEPRFALRGFDLIERQEMAA